MKEVKINKKDIELYYKFLDHKKQSELRFIEPKWKNSKPKPVQEWANNINQFIFLCEKYQGEMNLYVGLNERKPRGDLDEDVEFITNIGHDIDAHDGNPESFMTAQETAIKIKDYFVKEGHPEPMIICSGRGFWVIHHTSPIENTEENVKKIKEFGKKLKEEYEVEGIELDSSVYNPSRIARIPGTLNVSDEKNQIMSFIVNEPKNEEDSKLTEKIINMELTKTNYISNGEQPKTSCAFMDYCLSHEVPQGERHKIISRNMSLYLHEHPDRELLREQYFKIQKGSETELDQWLKSIDNNPDKDYPFSCGELIKFQKKYKIPLKCKGCPKYTEYRKELAAQKKIQKTIAIENEKDYSDLQKEVLIYVSLKDYDNCSELLVKELEKNNHIYTTKNDSKSEMWIYNEGIYVPNGKSFIREFCRKILCQTYCNYIANIVISKIETDTFIEEDDFFKNRYIEELPVENGILNVITKELNPFDPKKIFFNKLPVEYDLDAECPIIEKFLKEILTKKEDIDVAFELVGAGLYKDYFTEKAAMFVGSGRNGKSKFLELIKRLAGIENTCAVPIRSMKEDNSSLCELHGKLFNLAGDLSGGDLKDTGVFKETVGRDSLQAHRKFLTDLKFVNYAKHIFACNELPRVFDTTDGFWDKWVLLKFPYKFITIEEQQKLSEEERTMTKIKDPQIIDKLSTPEELSGFLNKALDGLDRLMKQKNFSLTEGTKEIKDFWIRNSDSFASFCIDLIKEDYEGYISKKALRKRFNKYCKKHKIKGSGDKAIKATLEDRYGVVDNRKMIDGEVINLWEGINFINNI